MATEKTVAIPARQTNFRWTVWTLMIFATAINFGDRGVLGAVAPLLIKAFHLTVAEYGIAASAFSWGYTPIQLIAGIFVARWGARRTWSTAMVVWSLCVVLTPLAPAFGLLLLFRFLFGASEGSNFPSAAAIVGAWFPTKERTFGLTPNSIGESLGLILATPLAIYLAVTFSWKVPFFVLGALALVWVALAKTYLRDRPRESSHVNSAELDYIEAGRIIDERPPAISWGRILSNRTVWGGAISLFSTAYLIYVALTFVPLYFNKSFHVPEAALAGFAVWPWVGAALGALAAGRLSDRLFRRTGRIRVARGYLGGASSLLMAIMLVVLTLIGPNPTVAVVLISVTMFLEGFGNTIYFIVPVDASPREPARTSGFVVGFASAAGIVAPIVTGFTVASTGNFDTAFFVAAGIALVGAIVAPTMIRDEDIIEPDTPSAA